MATTKSGEPRGNDKEAVGEHVGRLQAGAVVSGSDKSAAAREHLSDYTAPQLLPAFTHQHSPIVDHSQPTSLQSPFFINHT